MEANVSKTSSSERTAATANWLRTTALPVSKVFPDTNPILPAIESLNGLLSGAIEKGAHFRGDSYITARYTSSNLDNIKIQLAFSTTAVRNLAQALLLIQTSNA